MISKTIRSRVAGLQKKNNTPDGNPVWMLWLDDGRGFHTRPNANFAHGLDYSLLGHDVTVTVMGGFITDLEKEEAA